MLRGLFLRLLLALGVLLASDPASARAETRVGDFWIAAQAVAGATSLRSAENRRAESIAAYDFASGYSLAAEATAARTFTSADPLVADLANAIEKAYPGHVVGVNVPMTNAAGRVVTDADILLQNAVIQVKSGPGKGLTTQLLNTQAATNLPVIGYGPQLGGSLVRGIQANGGLVTRDAQLLIDVVAP